MRKWVSKISFHRIKHFKGLKQKSQGPETLLQSCTLLCKVLLHCSLCCPVPWDASGTEGIVLLSFSHGFALKQSFYFPDLSAKKRRAKMSILLCFRTALLLVLCTPCSLLIFFSLNISSDCLFPEAKMQTRSLFTSQTS